MEAGAAAYPRVSSKVPGSKVDSDAVIGGTWRRLDRFFNELATSKHGVAEGGRPRPHRRPPRPESEPLAEASAGAALLRRSWKRPGIPTTGFTESTVEQAALAWLQVAMAAYCTDAGRGARGPMELCVGSRACAMPSAVPTWEAPGEARTRSARSPARRGRLSKTGNRAFHGCWWNGLNGRVPDGRGQDHPGRRRPG